MFRKTPGLIVSGKHLTKSNRRKTTLKLRVVFNSESKSVTSSKTGRELKGLQLKSCVPVRKLLISEADCKKGFSLPERVKIGLWCNGIMLDEDNAKIQGAHIVKGAREIVFRHGLASESSS